MTFDVTAADPSALLDDATLAFDALPIPSDDPGRASVETQLISIAQPGFFFSFI